MTHMYKQDKRTHTESEIGKIFPHKAFTPAMIAKAYLLIIKRNVLGPWSILSSQVRGQKTVYRGLPFPTVHTSPLLGH